jgi:UDP-N-acetyl-D-galactosamine dehydrogenase
MSKFKNYNFRKLNIAVIGLGYVGLPLAVAFSKKRNVIGFDINKKRIKNLKNFKDFTLEVPKKELKAAINLSFSNKIEDIAKCQIYIITVPTPINKNKTPDLKLLKDASNLVSSVLKKDDIVIYESTVYPGVTEEICVPILEKKSGLIFNKNFYCGYSPERINPGDKKHRISDIKKVTSGSNLKIAKLINNLYKEIISAGTHMAPSIKIAEAAKAIENVQRDVNIALMNELAIIFNKLNIDTQEVIKAATTKWNFLPFKPGLVGGHCISVDPYYLAYKSLEVNYKPRIILSGRRINDEMGKYIVKKIIKLMRIKKKSITNTNALIMGFTFKENCPDTRNTGVIDIIKGLNKFNLKIEVYDPWADQKKVFDEYGVNLVSKPKNGKYDLIVLAVSHDEFKRLSLQKIKNFGKKDCIIYDIKYLFSSKEIKHRL